MKKIRLTYSLIFLIVIRIFPFRLYGQENLKQGEVKLISLKTDSLRQIPGSALRVITKDADSINQKINIIEDSIRQPYKVVQHKIDSVNTKIHKIESAPVQVESEVNKQVQDASGKINNKLSIKNQSYKINELNINTDGAGVKDILPEKSLPILTNRLSLPTIPSLKDLPELNIPPNFQWKNPDMNMDILQKYFPKEMRADAGKIREMYKGVNSKENIDKYIDQQARQISELGGLQKMDGHVQTVKSGMGTLSSLDQLRVKESLKSSKIREETMKKLGEKGQQYFGDHLEKIAGAKERMMKLKKKYSNVGSIGDLKNAKKQNSLNEEPLRKRIVLGGNIQLKLADPLSLDFSPTLGYRFNKKFNAGISGTYRYAITHDSKYKFHIPEKMYGYGGYVSYKLIKEFFGHMEFESMCTDINKDDKTTQMKWANGFFIGIGNEYRIYSSLHGTVILMYNTLHNSYSPDPHPWQVKFGFNLN